MYKPPRLRANEAHVTLRLERTTLRRLDDGSLSRVVGGDLPTTTSERCVSHQVNTCTGKP